MSQPEATMVAAIIAAIATVLTLIFTVANKVDEEFRTAHRDVIVDDLKAVGKAVHEVLALSAIQLKTLDGPQHPERYRAAADASKRLKEKRLDVRYTLWGLDDAFRTLSRLPDWIGHAKPSPKIAQMLFVQAKEIGNQIDLAVRGAYIQGRSPSKWRVYRVNSAVKSFKKTYNDFSATRTPTTPAAP
ncbi:hypothetical protein [Sphingomonas paucimobilis]|uniref:Uncharacterized protein n=1 Tax=Sphingomonas paucimobilis TaxID=13689 RepID=A0A7Y2PG35_SPHPI|nr:hypothetical protein [Sphingomonas paucimobilis]NNG59786.1 hypothetical protein [Sphingomonas paucimobilis]